MSLLGMALWFVGLLHFASARSNGNFFLCEVFAKNWGCKQFQDINQRNRNTKGVLCVLFLVLGKIFVVIFF